MGTTTIYSNWIAKIHECGLTNEQACGLAMLQAWTLTRPISEGEVPDSTQYWAFIAESDFAQLKETAFSIEDFARFVPELKLAGELLWVNMPNTRRRGDGEPANLLDIERTSESPRQAHINDVLLLRHRFDMEWCQRVGESLREEIRTPLHAYVFADYVADGLRTYDPEGFARILSAILFKRSPLAYMFSSGVNVNRLNGFEGYEPIQIALNGFMSNLDLETAELIWNLQRILFYKQPSGTPVNIDKQILPTSLFLEFAEPILTNFLLIHRDSYLQSTRLIASEYLIAKAGPDQTHFQLHELMDRRYGFLPSLQSDTLALTLVTNAAAFYTLCCLKIRNLTNRIDEMPALRMTDDLGLLWSRGSDLQTSLLEDAFQCFDIMLSWRLGATWGLFLETEDGFVQRVYVGDGSTLNDVESLFAKICTAYRPVSCVIAFLTEGRIVKGEDSGTATDAAFLCIKREGDVFLDVFRSGFTLEQGRFLDSYLGKINDSSVTQGLFPAVQDAMSEAYEYETVKVAQDELDQLLFAKGQWQFPNFDNYKWDN